MVFLCLPRPRKRGTLHGSRRFGFLKIVTILSQNSGFKTWRTCSYMGGDALRIPLQTVKDVSVVF